MCRLLLVRFIAVSVFLSGSTARAAQTIVFPMSPGDLSAHPVALAFTHNNSVGVVFLFDDSTQKTFLWSFLVGTSRAVDSYDTSLEFGTQDANSQTQLLVKAENAHGLVAVYGTDRGGQQKVLALRVDEAGHLSRLWLAAFENAWPSFPGIDFSPDGSTIAVIHNRAVPVASSAGLIDRLGSTLRPRPYATPRILSTSVESDGIPIVRYVANVDQLRASDGMPLATVALGESGLFPSIRFDESRTALVATAGVSVYVIGIDGGALHTRSKITPTLAGVTMMIGVGLTSDGAVLVAYGGYDGGASGDVRAQGSNLLYSCNLDAGTIDVTPIHERFIPSALDLTFNRDAGVVLVPLSAKVTPNGIGFDEVGSRFVNVLRVTSEDSLSYLLDAVIPRDHPATTAPHLINENNCAISATGSLGFVSAGLDRVYTFDCADGRVIDSIDVPPYGLQFIQVLDPGGLLVTGYQGNQLVFTPVELGPAITAARIKKRQIVIDGDNFLSGVRLQINGVDAPAIQRSSQDPGHQLTLDIGGKDLGQGPLSLVATNRDGRASAPFTLPVN